jgi:hypothetical protein
MRRWITITERSSLQNNNQLYIGLHVCRPPARGRDVRHKNEGQLRTLSGNCHVTITYAELKRYREPEVT